jgi:putative peptidoglycan lipid II flippase
MDCFLWAGALPTAAPFLPAAERGMGPMSQMLKSSGALAAATMASRVLGMVREMVYARFMGDGWVAAAFMMAFMVPNLFRRLLGEGVLTAAFIPIFKEKEKQAGEAEMWRVSNAVICGLTLLTIVLALAGIGVVSLMLAFGRFEGRAQSHLMLSLLRVMFPYVVLVCMAAVLMGMLNARGRFFAPALGASLLNLVMIASVLWLAPRLGLDLPQQIFGLAIGVVVAGVVQAGFQWPMLHRDGFRFQWVTPWGDPTVRRVAMQMLPGIAGVAAFQINVLTTQGIAYWLDSPNSPIVASFNYAVRLMELPQGVFGISLATYLLPTLSGLAADKDYPKFRSTLTQGLDYLLVVNLLATVLLVVLAEPMVRLLFERGRFGPDATLRASQALACLAPGLVAFSGVNIMARAFFALGDTTTPMKVSVLCLILNIFVTMALIVPLRHRGLGMANTLTSCLNVGLLLYAFRRKMPQFDLQGLRGHMLSLLSGVVASGLATWGTLWWWESRLGHGSLWLKLGAVFAPAVAGAAVYFGLALACKVPAARECLGLAAGRFTNRRPPAES